MLGKIKRNFKCKIVLWEGNLQFWRWFQAEALKYYDVVLINDSYAVPLLQGPAGLKNVIHMPFNMCDPDIHRKLDIKDEEEYYGSDIGFIGMGRPDRRFFFEKLTEIDLKLWGKEWDKSEKLRPYFKNDRVGMNEKIKIYQSTKINVNIQSDLCQIDWLSAKIFEIASCGGFFLTERKKDLSIFFKDEVNSISFSNLNELKEKIRYYLSHPEERKNLSDTIMKKVTNDYTYKRKLTDILSKINNSYENA
jgi:spore maturation protein CgeB